MPKRKLRFNFIDLLLLLLAAAAIFILVVVFVQRPKADDKVKIQYVVEIQNVDEAFKDLIKKGQPVQDAISRNLVGTVEGSQADEFQMITFDYDKKEEVLTSIAGRKTLKVTINAEAEKTRDAFVVNGVVIRVGKQYSLVFPNMYGVGFCTSLTDEKPKEPETEEQQ